MPHQPSPVPSTSPPGEQTSLCGWRFGPPAANLADPAFIAEVLSLRRQYGLKRKREYTVETEPELEPPPQGTLDMNEPTNPLLRSAAPPQCRLKRSHPEPEREIGLGPPRPKKRWLEKCKEEAWTTDVSLWSKDTNSDMAVERGQDWEEASMRVWTTDVSLRPKDTNSDMAVERGQDWKEASMRVWTTDVSLQPKDTNSDMAVERGQDWALDLSTGSRPEPQRTVLYPLAPVDFQVVSDQSPATAQDSGTPSLPEGGRRQEAAEEAGLAKKPPEKQPKKTPRVPDNLPTGARCGVCGEEPSGYHYNVITCEGCKQDSGTPSLPEGGRRQEAAEEADLAKKPPEKQPKKTPRVPGNLPTGARCGVCGEEPSGYHYNVITCEGCKGFFKRMMQASNQGKIKELNCKLNGNCPITSKENRSNCKSCRMSKCLTAGMKKELVKDEKDRKDLNMKKAQNKEARTTQLCLAELSEQEDALRTFATVAFAEMLNSPFASEKETKVTAAEFEEALKKKKTVKYLLYQDVKACFTFVLALLHQIEDKWPEKRRDERLKRKKFDVYLFHLLSALINSTYRSEDQSFRFFNLRLAKEEALKLMPDSDIGQVYRPFYDSLPRHDNCKEEGFLHLALIYFQDVEPWHFDDQEKRDLQVHDELAMVAFSCAHKLSKEKSRTGGLKPAAAMLDPGNDCLRLAKLLRQQPKLAVISLSICEKN